MTDRSHGFWEHLVIFKARKQWCCPCLVVVSTHWLTTNKHEQKHWNTSTWLQNDAQTPIFKLNSRELAEGAEKHDGWGWIWHGLHRDAVPGVMRAFKPVLEQKWSVFSTATSQNMETNTDMKVSNERGEEKREGKKRQVVQQVVHTARWVPGAWRGWLRYQTAHKREVGKALAVFQN